jgi:hypothetical protein
MGFRGQFARQQSGAADVRFGSKPDMTPRIRDVRFTTESGHSLVVRGHFRRFRAVYCRNNMRRHEADRRLPPGLRLEQIAGETSMTDKE